MAFSPVLVGSCGFLSSCNGDLKKPILLPQVGQAFFELQCGTVVSSQVPVGESALIPT